MIESAVAINQSLKGSLTNASPSRRVIGITNNSQSKIYKVGLSHFVMYEMLIFSENCKLRCGTNLIRSLLHSTTYASVNSIIIIFKNKIKNRYLKLLSPTLRNIHYPSLFYLKQTEFFFGIHLYDYRFLQHIFLFCSFRLKINPFEFS